MSFAMETSKIYVNICYYQLQQLHFKNCKAYVFKTFQKVYEEQKAAIKNILKIGFIFIMVIDYF